MGESGLDEVAVLHARGREAWPDVALELATFRAFMTERLEGATLESLNAAGLYLACACAAGDPRAHAALDSRYIATLDPALAHLDASGVAKEDVKQLLRVRFLIGEDGGRPRIAEYSGTSELRTWLRVAAIRIAISLRRKHHREDAPGDEVLVELPAGDPSPELDLMKHTYRAEFAEAFRSAVGALEPQQRNLLRQQVHDGLSIDRIGALYGVHRATAARWVASARETLIKEVRRELRVQLGVTPGELDSILELIKSRLDVSLRPFLISK
jgi:RNA polymerase sigma-70 factor (ECF subfamily)